MIRVPTSGGWPGGRGRPAEGVSSRLVPTGAADLQTSIATGDTSRPGPVHLLGMGANEGAGGKAGELLLKAQLVLFHHV